MRLLNPTAVAVIGMGIVKPPRSIHCQQSSDPAWKTAATNRLTAMQEKINSWRSTVARRDRRQNACPVDAKAHNDQSISQIIHSVNQWAAPHPAPSSPSQLTPTDPALHPSRRRHTYVSAMWRRFDAEDLSVVDVTRRVRVISAEPHLT